MTDKDGGPAFARPASPDCRMQEGMSLRDYFAAAALQGLSTTVFANKPQDIASAVYKIADAMLAEREE